MIEIKRGWDFEPGPINVQFSTANVELSLEMQEIHPPVFNRCFYNARHIAMKTGLPYVEGFAIVPIGGSGWLPFHHAWVMQKTHTIEVTWDDLDAVYIPVFSVGLGPILEKLFGNALYGWGSAKFAPRDVCQKIAEVGKLMESISLALALNQDKEGFDRYYGMIKNSTDGLEKWSLPPYEDLRKKYESTKKEIQ